MGFVSAQPTFLNHLIAITEKIRLRNVAARVRNLSKANHRGKYDLAIDRADLLMQRIICL